MRVDQGTLAEIFGVAKRTIRHWQEHGMPREGSRQDRQYDTEKCISWYVAHRAESASGSAEDGDLPSIEESERRWKLARARMKEIEVKERRDELIDLQDLLDLVEDVVTTIRTKLLHLPGRRIAEIAATTDRAEVREIRMQSVREILEELQDLAGAARREEREKIERLDEEGG